MSTRGAAEQRTDAGAEVVPELLGVPRLRELVRVRDGDSADSAIVE